MKINLMGGDTPSRSVLASTQRTLNLYAEANNKDLGEPGLVTHYPTPGLSLLGTTPNGEPIRGLYRANNGDLYCAAGFDVYYIDATWKFNLVGTMAKTNVLNPVKFTDNGTSVILCDGTPTNGYAINMAVRLGLTPLFNPSASDALTKSSTGWLGSTHVDFSDGYLIANFIGTPTFYISNSEDIIFDPLQFAGKSAIADSLVGAIVQHRVIWLIGQLSTEIWYNSAGGVAGSTFPFEIMPGIVMDWGCKAPYSIAKAETSIFFLAQNLNGETVVLRGSGYNVQRVSTHALEHIFNGYSTVSDCIAYCYMQQGHSFYVMNFPSADATWVYDLADNQWHERCYLDSDGVEHRHRSTFHAHAYNVNVVNDWQNGNLYALDLNAYTDNGSLIKRLIGFPRQIDGDEDHRLLFRNFVAEMDCGETTIETESPQLTLRWSDDKGKTWSNGMIQSFGKTGKFSTMVKFNRLGMSRNRVFQLEWAANSFTALQAAFVEVEKAGT